MLWAILILSLIGILILYLEFRRRKKGVYRLEKDVSGFWRYHKETSFCRVETLSKNVGGKDRKKDSDKLSEPKCVVVISFEGDLRARQHTMLADFVDEIEINRDKIEEVVVLINSSGGMVSSYGHAYSEMERINRLGINLTVCVDVVAASGGYLMSLPANRILAAPFAIVGSVGVLAFVPNVRGLLEKLSIEPRTFTAGKYKRTVDFFDDANEEQVSRFKSQLEAVQRMFLDVVKKYRPDVDFERVETGDHWTAQESLDEELGLVDELCTSSEYLLSRNREVDIVRLSQKHKFWSDGLGRFMGVVTERLALLLNQSRV